jgi:hypothetical protein
MGLEERPIGQEEEFAIPIPHPEGFDWKFRWNMVALIPFQRDRRSPVINSQPDTQRAPFNCIAITGRMGQKETLHLERSLTISREPHQGMG